jgi:hypothetical protein
MEDIYYTLYSDDDVGTWYPKASSSLGLKHNLHIIGGETN